MKNKKIYYSSKNEKHEILEIYWIKNKFINKGYHELTVNFNGACHSYDINQKDKKEKVDIKQVTVPLNLEYKDNIKEQAYQSS